MSSSHKNGHIPNNGFNVKQGFLFFVKATLSSAKKWSDLHFFSSENK
jgi:hypothetical protein